MTITKLTLKPGNSSSGKRTAPYTGRKNSASTRADLSRHTRNSEKKSVKTPNMQLPFFSYVSSHDLQEPLRKIQTFSSRILEKEHQNLSEAGKDYFKRMQHAANRMQMIIDNLIEYSGLEVSNNEFERTDLNKIIELVKNDMKNMIREKQVTIKSADLGMANIIPPQFKQLAQHLICNSIKFSRPDKLPVISIKSKSANGRKFGNPLLEPEKNYCRITFSDNGIGFEPKFNESIFDIFQRLHGKDEYEGTGIGLAICKKITDNHQGIITASGEKDKGATFEIYVPEK